MKKYHYVYAIIKKSTQQYYIGSRSSKLPPIEDIGKKYMSSSKDKDFITEQKNNPHNFEYKIIGTYDTREIANQVEINLHKFYDVAKNKKFINRANLTNTKFAEIGQVTVVDKNGESFRVDVDDPRYISGEFKHNHSGHIPVRDSNGNTYKVHINDPRLKTGELNHVNIGKVTVVFPDGTTGQVSNEDPNYINGTYKHVAHGHISVKDKDGNYLSVSKDDPRLSSGELVAACIGMIRITNGKENKSIYPEEFEEYELLGYWKGMIKNIKETQIWMNDGIRRYKVNISEIEEKEKLGWKKGHKSKESKPCFGKITVNDGIKNIIVDINDVDYYLNTGYERGRVKTNKGNRNKGRIAVHKGDDRLKILPSELDNYLSLGYKRGMPTKGKVKRILLWINNGIIEIQVDNHNLEYYMNRGFNTGRLNT